MQLYTWRWSWRRTVIVGMVAPLLGIITFSSFARDSGREALSYILIGNAVLSLMFENQNKVANRFAYMRAVGSLSYFATLPIQKFTLILATMLSFLFLSLPSLIVTLFFGSLFLNIPVAINPLILIVIPLCATPLAGLGALIGASARTPEEASALSLLLTLLMVSVGPIIIPPDRLPPIMLTLSNLSPATYAASALRQVFLGPVTSQIWLDVGILAIFTAVVLWLVALKMDWRQN